MTVLSFAPIVLSLLLLAAHFLRYGETLAVILALALLGLLFVRKPWVARTIQVALLAATAEWLRTLLQLALERMHAGVPFMRMVVILSAVALLALGGTLVFQTRRIGSIYGLGRDRQS
jgi:hypothetical protein